MVASETPFYENDAWSDVPVKTFEPGLEVAAGSTLDYYCDYRNGESRTVYQGPRSTDEMCAMVASYYPADIRTSNCLDEDGNQAGEWIGEGSATCAETLECLIAAVAQDTNLFDPITDCMVVADPAVSRETSDLLLCFLNSTDPETDCSGPIATCQKT